MIREMAHGKILFIPLLRYVKKTQDQSTTSTTLSDVSELFFNVNAGNYYFYEFYLVAEVLQQLEEWG